MEKNIANVEFFYFFSQLKSAFKAYIFTDITNTDEFTDITNTDELQIRNNDYNYINKASVKSNLDKFPLKQILSTWNSLSIDLKSTGEKEEFQALLKESLLYNYSFETDCPLNCYSCN